MGPLSLVASIWDGIAGRVPFRPHILSSMGEGQVSHIRSSISNTMVSCMKSNFVVHVQGPTQVVSLPYNHLWVKDLSTLFHLLVDAIFERLTYAPKYASKSLS
jgi:hypothetical protein